MTKHPPICDFWVVDCGSRLKACNHLTLPSQRSGGGIAGLGRECLSECRYSPQIIGHCPKQPPNFSEVSGIHAAKWGGGCVGSCIPPSEGGRIVMPESSTSCRCYDNECLQENQWFPGGLIMGYYVICSDIIVLICAPPLPWHRD